MKEFTKLQSLAELGLMEAKKKSDKQALTDKEDPSVKKGAQKLGDKKALGAPAAKKVSVPVAPAKVVPSKKTSK